MITRNCGTHRTPTSQFVYTSASPGELPITYALMIPPLVTPQARAFLEQNATWTTPAIGTNVDCGAASPTGGQVQVCWARGNPGADPRMQRIGANVDVTYRGLPPKNSDFGRKRVEVEVKDVDASIGVGGSILRSIDHADFEVYYSGPATNHPSQNPGDPNWYQYYFDATLSSTALTPTLAFNYLGPSSSCQSGWLACWIMEAKAGKPFVTKVQVTDVASAMQLHPFAATIDHEVNHENFFRTTMWGGRTIWDLAFDSDKDGAPDVWEQNNNCDSQVSDRSCWEAASEVYAADQENWDCIVRLVLTGEDWAEGSVQHGPFNRQLCPYRQGSK